MKAIIVSDLHADWHTDGFERLEDIRNALEYPVVRAIDLKKQGKDVRFIALGDYSNPASRNVHRAIALIVETAGRLGDEHVPNYWMVGNHDVIEDGLGSHTLLALKAAGFPLTCVIDRPAVVDFGGLFLPYTAAAWDYDPAEQVPKVGTIRAVFGHLSIPGILYEGSETTHMPRGRTMRFPLEECRQRLPGVKLFNGHYHRRQVFEGINVPGSLVRLTHGEEGNANGYLEVEL